jgi:hypothetical protein
VARPADEPAIDTDSDIDSDADPGLADA